AVEPWLKRKWVTPEMSSYLGKQRYHVTRSLGNTGRLGNGWVTLWVTLWVTPFGQLEPYSISLFCSCYPCTRLFNRAADRSAPTVIGWKGQSRRRSAYACQGW